MKERLPILSKMWLGIKYQMDLGLARHLLSQLIKNIYCQKNLCASMRFSSVKPVLWLLINLHHLFSNGAAVNAQSRSSLTSYAISCSISQMNRIWLWTRYCVAWRNCISSKKKKKITSCKKTKKHSFWPLCAIPWHSKTEQAKISTYEPLKQMNMNKMDI